MAESSTAGSTKKQQQEEEERGPTRRVVLSRERVLVIPASVRDEVLAETLKGVKFGPEKRLEAALKAKTVDAWLPVGEFEGASKERAIEAYAGKAGTADAKIGAFKAPTVSAWAGGVLHEAPPAPLVERKPLD